MPLLPTTRRAASALAVVFAGALGVVAVADAASAADPARCGVPELPASRLDEARAILADVPLVDGHNDLPWALRERVGDRLDEIDLRSDLGSGDAPLHTDVARLRAGGVGGQFWSVYIPVDHVGPEAVQLTLEQIDVVHRLAELYPDVFELARTADDVERIHAAGKVASLVGVEGGHQIGGSLAVLRQLHALGASYLTLTHWQNNELGDSATDDPEHGGLSAFGREVVRELNRLGMLVDLSHTSEETMHDALDETTAPVVFSHSSARGVFPHPRNVPDAVLDRLPENGGVVMVTFVPPFVAADVAEHYALREAETARLAATLLGDPAAREAALAAWDAAHPAPRATLRQVADHLDHVRRRIGARHVGIGSDFDGIPTVPRGLEDVSCYPALLAELLERGWSREEVAAAAGSNVLRVMRTAAAEANRLRTSTAPSAPDRPKR